MSIPKNNDQFSVDFFVYLVVFFLLYFFVDYRAYPFLSEERCFLSIGHATVLALVICSVFWLLNRSNSYQQFKQRQKNKMNGWLAERRRQRNGTV